MTNSKPYSIIIVNKECMYYNSDGQKKVLYVPSSENKNAIAPGRAACSKARVHVSRPLCILRRRPV